MASQPIYQFYAELNDYKPKMWRRFQVLNNITMARLVYILMTLFEMQASHLFCLDVPIGENLLHGMRQTLSEEEAQKIRFIHKEAEVCRYEIKNEFTEDFADEMSCDAIRTKLSRVLSVAGEVLQFSYDFGDGWMIRLVLEEVIIDKGLSGKELPRVLEGTGYGIIEDCGGPFGLEELAKAFRKKKGAQYQEYCEWLGVNKLDLDTFDLEDMNFRLKKVPRIYTYIYEHGLEPTKRSMDLLIRKYKK